MLGCLPLSTWPLDTRQWAAILIMIDYQWHAEGEKRIKLVVQQGVVTSRWNRSKVGQRRTSGGWESHVCTNPQWHLQIADNGDNRELVAIDTRSHKAQDAIPLPLHTLHNRQRRPLAHQWAVPLMKKWHCGVGEMTSIKLHMAAHKWGE